MPPSFHPDRSRRIRSRLRALAAAGVALLLFALGACERSERETAASPAVVADAETPLVDPSLPPREAGRLLYERLECAGCHESAAVPGLVVVPLHDLDDRYSDASLAAFLAAPPPPMPDFELGEAERLALAAHLRATFE